MAIVRGQVALIEQHLPEIARRPCFHCGEPLDSEEPTFLWMGRVECLVMHMPCLADWLRRAQKDRDKFFGVTS